MLNRINKVQVSQRVDHRFTDIAAGAGIILKTVRLVGAHYHSMTAFHQIKDRTDDAWVFAEHVRLRRQRKDRMQRLQDATLAGHVMGPRWHRTKRRPAHHKLLMAEAEQIS